MNTKTILTFAGCIGLLLSGTAGAADMHTQVIAATCMACHGPGGKSLSPDMPSLAGMKQDEFVKSMKAFASGEREASIMKRHAAGYTEAEIEAMGAYFAGLK